MATAYTSFLRMNGKELINSGRGGSAGRQLLSSAKQVITFKPSISKASNSAVSSWKTSRQQQQVLTQVETPVLAPAPSVAEAPQLFAILVPAEEVTANAQAQVPQFQFSQTAPTVVSAPAPASVLQSNRQTVAPGSHISVAVQSQHSLQVVDVPTVTSSAAGPEIHIPASSQPIELAFHSQSSPINVRQVHIPGVVPPPQHSQTEEQPEILKLTVVKPLVQEINEIVTPQRKIQQTVLPVQETVNQVVTKAQTQNQGVQSAQITAKQVASAPQLSLFSNAVASGFPKFTLSSQPVSFTSGNQPKIFLAITKVNGNVIRK